VLSTDAADLEALAAAPADANRQFVRHVLARVAEHGALAAATPGAVPALPDADDDGVVVSLMSPSRPAAPPD